jgi:hypothetical protein
MCTDVPDVGSRAVGTQGRCENDVAIVLGLSAWARVPIARVAGVKDVVLAAPWCDLTRRLRQPSESCFQRDELAIVLVQIRVEHEET